MSATPDTASPEQTAAAASHAAVLGRLFDEPITELPEDLYIPPEALRVFLRPSRGRSTCCST